MTYLVLFAFNFFSVMVKVIQQIQVVNFEYLKIIPGSFAMSICFAVNVAVIAPMSMDSDLVSLMTAGLVMGLGGVLGSWCGMKIKQRDRREG